MKFNVSINRIIIDFYFSNFHEKCLRINQRTSNTLELNVYNCNNNEDSKILTFVKKFNSLSTCPTSIGHLSIEANVNQRRQYFLRDKLFHLSVGCDHKEKLITYQVEKGSKLSYLIANIFLSLGYLS